jgi:hypothetical protein
MLSPAANAPPGANAPNDAPPPRIPRIAFKKSRGGCRRCKERKVKCDEGKPTCHNCARHHAACEYLPAPAKRRGAHDGVGGPDGGAPRGASSTPGASSTGSAQRPRKRPLPDLDRNGGDAEAEEEGEEDDDDEGDEGEGLGLPPARRRLLELQLLHHFVTVVAQTFSAADNPIVRDVWTSLVPRTAFAHGFLLNTLLAFSALHVMSTTSRAAAGGFAPVEDASLLPAEMLVGGAAQACAGVDAERAYRVYLGLAFRGQREAIRQAEIGPGNANALLFSSILLSYQALHVDRVKARRHRRGGRAPRSRTGGAGADASGTGANGGGEVKHEPASRDDGSEDAEGSDESTEDEPEKAYCPPVRWLRMVRGIQETTLASGAIITHDAVVRFLASQGGEPNFLDRASLMDPRGLEPFGALLDYEAHPEPRDGRVDGEAAAPAPGEAGAGSAAWVDEDTRAAYESALMYVGTVFMGMQRGEDDRVLFRRIIGLGFATPERFTALVEAARPRALVIVAYHMSMASRLGHHWLFRGVAEREVRGLRRLVPPEWAWAMEWAVRMLRAGAEESRLARERATWRPKAEGGA